MNREDWDRTNDPWVMLRSLGWMQGGWRTPAHISGRKLRLLACAGVRAAGAVTLGGWPEAPTAQAVSAAELMADGRITASGINAAARRCRRVDGPQASWAAQLLHPSPALVLEGWPGPVGFPLDSPVLAGMVRCVAGGPSGPPRLPDGPVGPCRATGCIDGRKENPEGWLVWTCGRCKGTARAPGPPLWLDAPAVRPLAVAAYEDRACGGCGGHGGTVPPDLPCGLCHGAGVSWRLDGERLGVLADCLEEAGCGDGPLLAHLRSPGPHVRGCWALDHALGRR